MLLSLTPRSSPGTCSSLSPVLPLPLICSVRVRSPGLSSRLSPTDAGARSAPDLHQLLLSLSIPSCPQPAPPDDRTLTSSLDPLYQFSLISNTSGHCPVEAPSPLNLMSKQNLLSYFLTPCTQSLESHYRLLLLFSPPHPSVLNAISSTALTTLGFSPLLYPTASPSHLTLTEASELGFLTPPSPCHLPSLQSICWCPLNSWG